MAIKTDVRVVATNCDVPVNSSIIRWIRTFVSSPSGLNSVMITELGRTLGFLSHPIFLVFPFGKTTYDFPPLWDLPPENLIYFLAFVPFFQIKLDSFFTAPVVETIPLLDAIFIISPFSNISSAFKSLNLSEIVFPSLINDDASRLAYNVNPPA